MTGRDFVACAERLSHSPDEADLRSAVSRAYYGASTRCGRCFLNAAFRCRKRNRYTSQWSSVFAAAEHARGRACTGSGLHCVLCTPSPSLKPYQSLHAESEEPVILDASVNLAWKATAAGKDAPEARSRHCLAYNPSGKAVAAPWRHRLESRRRGARRFVAVSRVVSARVSTPAISRRHGTAGRWFTIPGPYRPR